MKRVPTVELLDSDAGTPAEVAASLCDLRSFNRWFGGVSTTQRMIEQVASANAQPSLTLLEVASGSGYVPQTVRDRLRGSRIALEITLLDRAPSHLRDGASAVVADAVSIPFRDASFDLVSCSLFAHHLAPDQLMQFARESLRVCRVAVLINDLIRSPLHLSLAYAGLPLYRSRLTRHDAPASVRQAYTRKEMRAMLLQAGAAKVEISRHYLYRMGAIAWKH
jgi:ubiquinone/menaquinone biosynthesis C-methylase UbiE